MKRLLLFAALMTLTTLIGCDETTKTVPSASVSINDPPLPPPPPPREGCTRTGALVALESDPSCVVAKASGNEETMRAALKSVSISVGIEPNEVIAGGTALFTITMTNTSSAETTIYLEARPRAVGPRTDWSRVVGIPEPKNTTPDAPHLFFPMTTLDSGDHDVDALPIVSGTLTLAASPITILQAHLRPGGKLTHTTSWWALRIPAPAPIFQDDAGHRYYPKTSATALLPGEYAVVVEVPLLNLTREERKYSTRVRVVRANPPDAGKH